MGDITDTRDGKTVANKRRFVHPRTSHEIGCGDATLRLPSGSERRISINYIDTRAPCTKFFKGIGPAP